MRKRLRARRIRSLPLLAVVLPLGAGAPEPERPPIPQEIVRDPAAAAAVGGVLHRGDRPYACAGVLLRSTGEGPTRGASAGTALVATLGAIGALDVLDGGAARPDGAEGGGETRLELRPASAAAPPGFELWEGCASLPEHLKEGRLRLSVAGATPGPSGGDGRITAVEVRPEIWTWRPVRAPERGGGEQAVDEPTAAERGRGVAPGRGDA